MEMNCKKCGSDNISFQAVNKVKLKRKHGVIYWLLIGWWLRTILWVFFTIPYLIIRILKPKKYKIKNKTVNMAVCQKCGNSWEVKNKKVEISKYED